MATIEEFILRVKTQGAEGIKNLSKDIADLGQAVGIGGNSISALTSKLGPLGLGLTAVAGATVALGLKAIDLADQIDDISAATGIAGGALLNFKASLITAGGKAEDFSTLAAKLNQNLGDAATGNEKAQKAFQKLGVFVRDAGGNVRDTGDVLRDAISRLAGIEDPATRAALAVDIFGKTANKLDFTKLNAANDFAKDEQIKQLAKYREAIDAISNSVTNSLLTAFGKLAIAIDESQKKATKAEEEANKRGNVGPRVTAIGGNLAVMPERPMTKQEQAAYKLEQSVKEQTANMPGELRNLQGRTAAQKGDYGARSEQSLKAAAESAKRTEEELAESRKQIALRSASDMMAIGINANAEIAKAALEINNKEYLTKEEKEKELAAKTTAIRAKAETDLQKLKSSKNAKAYAEEAAQAEEANRLLSQQQDAFAKADLQAQKLVETFTLANEQQQQRFEIEQSLTGLSSTDANTKLRLFELEQKRLALIKSIADTEGITGADQAKRTQAANQAYADEVQRVLAQAETTRLNQENFSKGWDDAYAKYLESSKNASDQARTYFDTFTRGFEDAFVKMAETGKLSFKDLANSLIAEMVRIQAKRIALGFLNFLGLGGGGSTGGFLPGVVTGGFGAASGGPVVGGIPRLIGEAGPEMFIPSSNGTIIPNSALGGSNITNVSYTIQAVDASSFRALVARDPGFIHAVAERGRQSQPSRRA